MDEPILKAIEISVSTGEKCLLNPVTLEFQERGVHGIIGPSGAGKSTFLKCLNRLCELSPGLRVSGRVLHRGRELYDSGIDPDELRTRIGMIFQQPVVFPVSILANVLFGVRHLGLVPKRDWPELAEKVLRQAALWDEVKDRLKKPGKLLSIGQQQRLCLARTLATGPEIILMDEPTSALDPRSTRSVESLIDSLREKHTLIIVTHNLPQAERLCDRVAFIGLRDGAGTLLSEGAISELRLQKEIPELDDYLCSESSKN